MKRELKNDEQDEFNAIARALSTLNMNLYYESVDRAKETGQNLLERLMEDDNHWNSNISSGGWFISRMDDSYRFAVAAHMFQAHKPQVPVFRNAVDD